MKINNIQNNNINFGYGIHPEAKAILAKMITDLKVKGKLQEATDCIQLAKNIEKKAQPNHLIAISEYLKKISVFADDSKIGSGMDSGKITSKTLKKALIDTEKFLDEDSKRIPVVRKISDTIFSQLKDDNNGILSAGWHGIEDTAWSGVRHPDGKGRIIAGKLAKLSLKKNNPQVIEDGLKIFRAISENPGECRIQIDNVGDFSVLNLRTKKSYLINHFDFKEDDVLSQLKKLEKTVRKQEKINNKIIKKEQASWDKLINRDMHALAKIERREKRQEAFKQTFLYKLYNKTKEYFANMGQDKKEVFNNTLAQTQKELGIK